MSTHQSVWLVHNFPPILSSHNEAELWPIFPVMSLKRRLQKRKDATSILLLEHPAVREACRLFESAWPNPDKSRPQWTALFGA